MRTHEEFEALADACISNHAAILQHGSTEMQMASRMLLYALAQEIQRRKADEAPQMASDDS